MSGEEVGRQFEVVSQHIVIVHSFLRRRMDLCRTALPLSVAFRMDPEKIFGTRSPDSLRVPKIL